MPPKKADLPGFTSQALIKFLAECLRLEGAGRQPWANEYAAVNSFLLEEKPEAASMLVLARVFLGVANAKLKEADKLDALLATAYEQDPYLLHMQFLAIEPFNQLNGLLGRVLWAWRFVRMPEGATLEAGFLLNWYIWSMGVLAPKKPEPAETRARRRASSPRRGAAP